MSPTQKNYLISLGQKARAASRKLAAANTSIKNRALHLMAKSVRAGQDRILSANALDIAAARDKGLGQALVKRLELDQVKIEAMARGLEEVAALPDPVGEVVTGWRRPNGLEINQIRVPFGVIAVIYESRPNVSSDAAALALKAGNAVILRGGSETLTTNRTLVDLLSGTPAAIRAAIERATHRAGEIAAAFSVEKSEQSGSAPGSGVVRV